MANIASIRLLMSGRGRGGRVFMSQRPLLQSECNYFCKESQDSSKDKAHAYFLWQSKWNCFGWQSQVSSMDKAYYGKIPAH